MAIFDANKTMYLAFHVVLTDAAAVAAHQATYPDGVERAPYDPGPPPGGAAVEFQAPFRGYTAPAASEAPFTWTEWSGVGEQGGPYPLNVATFRRRTGGFFGIGGTTVTYKWLGDFMLAGSGGSGPVGEQAEIGRRLWVEGFETPGLGAVGYSGSAGNYYSKDASRHVGGMGLALRGSTALLPALVDQFITGITITKNWQRFYVRLRRKPTATAFFWATSTFPSALVGTVLGINPAGNIEIFTQSAVGVRTSAGVVPGDPLEEWSGLASHHCWHKIDVLLDVIAGSFRLFLDGALAASVGGVTATKLLSAGMGDVSTTPNDLYIDIDDWTSADIPVRTGVERLNGKDWVNGTKIALVRPIGFSGNHSANWTGDYRVLIQNPGSIVVATPAELTSSTSGALAAVNTDAETVVDADAGSLGVAAMLVVLESKRGTTSGTLGYSVAGGAAVMTAITQQTSLNVNGAMYSANTVTATDAEPQYPDATPIELRHAKGADAGAATMASLHAQVEMNGKWGLEDYTPAEIAAGIETEPMSGTGPHNYPYPRSPWAKMGLEPPISPVINHGGTYVGNGTGQDLNFREPVHFLIIRPLTGNTGGYVWISTALGSHRNWQQGITAQVVDAQEDPSFTGALGENAQQQRYRIRIAGNNSQINAVGVTYQYIAVMDPGMRYMINGTLAHKTALATRVHPIMNAEMTPEFGFFLAEDGSATTTIRLYAKGAGQAAATIVDYSPSVVTNALTFQSGAIETQPNFHALAGGVGTAYSLWRKHDGNSDTGEAKVVAFGSYIGDGAASRVITWGNPASTRRPMWAIIFAESGSNGYQRDPSHAGSNSSTQTGSEVTTGITAGGVDTFTVAVGANGNGIVYTYFVLPAIADCIGNNGWGCNGEVGPVEPTPPTGGPWTPPTKGPTTPPGTTPPGPCPPNDPDCSGPEITVECKSGTTAMVNRALARIGQSKQIADITTDTGQEAATALLVYGSVINQTLRDFPWPFASRWVALTLVGGTSSVPVNGEWQYAYRRPEDCVWERRIAASRGGAVDPTPPAFELSQDDTGGLIYTNQAAAYLEYTARPLCAAASVDALFREALMWRLAAALAVSLGKMGDRSKACLDEYQGTLQKAEATIRPGKPGPTSATVDPDAAVKLLVVNRGLIRIGARTITHYTADQSREAQAARLIFDEEYRSVLQDFPWAFATRYATPVLVAGTSSAAVNFDWQYSFRLPTDAVVTRRLVREGTGRRWDPIPSQFRLTSDATGGLLLTDEVDPVIEYTALVSISAADALFRDALAWRLAASLAPSLASVDVEIPEQTGRGPEPTFNTDPRVSLARQSDRRMQIRAAIATNAWAMYRAVLRQAEANNANQQQQDPSGDANWIEGR
jgi:hypothetical protein